MLGIPRDVLGTSKVREVLGRSEPVMHSVDIRHGNAGELFLRDTCQTTEVDAVHLSNRRLGSDTEGTDAADPAEIVQILAGVEFVLDELRPSCQETEVLGGRYRRPEPGSPADRAVATIGRLGQVEVSFEADRSAMALAAVRLSMSRGQARWGLVEPNIRSMKASVHRSSS